MNDETSDDGFEIRFPGADASLRGILFQHGTTPGPAVVLLPDVHGVAPLYREIAARLAAAGFHTLVLDVYSREGAPRLADMEAVQAWLAAMPDARVLGDVEAAVLHLQQRPEVTGAVGIVGFCVGGQYALMAACRSTRLSACVAFYGMLRHGRPGAQKLPAPLETAADLRCPLLGLFGADDPLIPPEDLAALRVTLERHGKSFAMHTFPGAGHAFMNDRRPDAYRPGVAAEAFSLAAAFLGRTLG